MKKKLIASLALLLLVQTAFADIWTVQRGHCFLQKRFIANARVSALAFTTYSTGYNAWGQWVGTGPRAAYYDQCNSSDGGCTRPRTAECQRSGTINDITYSGPFGMITGTHPFWGHARITLHFGGPTNQIRRISGRGIAGTIGDYQLDSATVASLNSDGWSSGYTTGEAEVDDLGNLKISGIAGTLAISKNTDHFSLLKIMVIKERDDLTEAEAAEAEKRMQEGDFGEVVHTSELRIDRKGIHKTGVFEVLQGELEDLSNDDSLTILLKGFSTGERLSVQLGEHEHLSTVFISDGGFDISSAVVETPMARYSNRSAVAPKVSLTSKEAFEPELFPNPATQGLLSIRAFAEADQEQLKLEITDASGRVTYKLHEATLRKGANDLLNIQIGHLTSGIYFGRITVGNRVFIQKFTIQ